MLHPPHGQDSMLALTDAPKVETLTLSRPPRGRVTRPTGHAGLAHWDPWARGFPAAGEPKASKLQRTKSNLTVLSEDQASRRARQAAEAELPKAESALGKPMDPDEEEESLFDEPDEDYRARWARLKPIRDRSAASLRPRALPSLTRNASRGARKGRCEAEVLRPLSLDEAYGQLTQEEALLLGWSVTERLARPKQLGPSPWIRSWPSAPKFFRHSWKGHRSCSDADSSDSRVARRVGSTASSMAADSSAGSLRQDDSGQQQRGRSEVAVRRGGSEALAKINPITTKEHDSSVSVWFGGDPKRRAVKNGLGSFGF
ncbi:unnamed protein product [Durusdinium trenchii]|uniref:Uncharacterized protein n=1 Tax=Durusdinium trenchii TaxID=1381693 RepID=A0ABP0J6B1_9DINO